MAPWEYLHPSEQPKEKPMSNELVVRAVQSGNVLAVQVVEQPEETRGNLDFAHCGFSLRSFSIPEVSGTDALCVRGTETRADRLWTVFNFGTAATATAYLDAMEKCIAAYNRQRAKLVEYETFVPVVRIIR